jgi:rhamnopyranosyl-N-acetylglucosaminyl-diphospho-decaprenol beta-1,3/1,4-galactofuranosyltransferase
MTSVTAVVVTYRRQELLKECLEALAAQTRPVDRILVVDNRSEDGTVEMVRASFPGVDVLELPENVGGAGGFHEGMKAAHAAGADWIWLMDDDTIPRPDALERLLAAREQADRPPMLLSSRAVWTDGTLHPMNFPGFERHHPELVIAGCERGLMPLRTATFVSLLVHREAVDRYGLPLKRFFIWSDDIEYTARIMRDHAGYLVPDSVVVHKTKQAYTAISTSGERFYFHIRNTLYMLRGTAWTTREKPSLVFILFTSSLAYLQFNRFRPRNIAIIARGLRDGLKPGAPLPSRP